jgi:hypothetical protein
MYNMMVTITSSEEISSTEEFDSIGGAILAADPRFDDVFYHHYLADNNLEGTKTLINSTTMTIERNGVTEEQKTILEEMYQIAKIVFQDNGWNVIWTFE